MSQVTAVSPLTSYPPDLRSTRDPARCLAAPFGAAVSFPFSGEPPPVQLSGLVPLLRRSEGEEPGGVPHGEVEQEGADGEDK